MAKGNPNDESMKINFVAKVWDEKAQDYKPLYIAPDATDEVRGDVYLSDAVDGTENAETGVTAATPAAVKKAYDAVASKVDKNVAEDQSISSSLLPKVNNSKSLGSESLKWRSVYATTFYGALDGNAASASKLQTPRQMTIITGKDAAGTNNLEVSATFDGQTDISWNVNRINASIVNVGTLPLSVIPKAALEHMIKVENQEQRFALTTDKVQDGDTVYQVDTGIMYLVVDQTKLSSEAGYQEYKAGSAVLALEAEKLVNARNIQTNLSSTNPASFDGSLDVAPGVSGTLGVGNGGTGLTSSPLMLINLSSNNTDGVLKVDPRPGVTGTLGIKNGGTGADNADGAWTNLGGGEVGKLNFATTNQTTTFLRGDGEWMVVSTDDKMTEQSSVATNSNFPLLFKKSANGNNETSGVNFNANLTINPSTGNITAETFTGDLVGNAQTASSAQTAVKATNADSAAKLSTSAGSAGTPVYFSGGVPIACSYGTVAVGTTQPTDTGVLWWIDTSS